MIFLLLQYELFISPLLHYLSLTKAPTSVAFGLTPRRLHFLDFPIPNNHDGADYGFTTTNES
jgi:hypothetical protein